MKYFLDTEFIEGFKKPLSWLPTIGNCNKPYHFIQLISIGIKCEDGREYYAISNEFNPADANDWVRDNVLAKLPPRWKWVDNGSIEAPFDKVDTWLSNFHISNQIADFIFGPTDSICGETTLSEAKKYKLWDGAKDPEFYAYYADYDWVLFCSLFGTMMDLPRGFPMYAIDLKQTLDEKCWNWNQMVDYRAGWVSDNSKEPALSHCLEIFKSQGGYPKENNEHNALSDARWNFRLYKFLQTI